MSIQCSTASTGSSGHVPQRTPSGTSATYGQGDSTPGGEGLDWFANENVDLRRKLEEVEQRPANAKTQVAELKRELFGPKSDRLTSEQEALLSRLSQDLEAESQRPAVMDT